MESFNLIKAFFMDLFVDNFGVIIQVVSFLLVASAYYWKIRIDLKVVEMRIEKIEDDREEKWIEYNNQKIKSEEKSSNQCKKLNDVITGIQEIKTNLKWLMKKK